MFEERRAKYDERRAKGEVRKLTTATFLAAVMALMVLPSAAWAIIKAEAMTLEFQARNSDIIARGTCVDAVTTFSNGHLITTYKIAVKKYLKSPSKTTVQSRPVLFVSELGGRISKPLPIEENYDEMPVLFKTEEVVLFLQSPETFVSATAQKRYESLLAEGRVKPSPLMTNYRLTTLNVSKLTIVTDPRTGMEMVTRITFDPFGILPSSEAVQRYVQAIQSQSDYIDVQRQGQTVRIPVQPLTQATGGQAAQSVDSKMRQMRFYSSTWERFQQQVDGILRGQKIPEASLPLGAARQSAP